MSTPSRSPLLRWLRNPLEPAGADMEAEIRSRMQAATDPDRRRMLRTGALLALASGAEAASAAPRREAPKVAVIGGGLAGLTAAYELSRAGIDPDVFEASSRLGGRCYSDRETFAGGQIAERGGELLDSSHREIIGLARRLGLTLDDVLEAETDGTAPWIWFNGELYTPEAALRDFQPVHATVRRQARAIGDPTYRTANAASREIDAMSVSDWIERHVPGGNASRLGRYIRAALEENFATEAVNLSAIIAVNMLAPSTREDLDVYGGSDQRFHIREGNDALAHRLAAALRKPVEMDSPLVALTKRSDGRCEVTVRRGSGLITDRYDRVILALPFSNLRDIDLTRAGLRQPKLRAIQTLPMGASSKLQLQFDYRLWQALGNTGYLLSDGRFHSTWEVTRAQSGTQGILNFWSGGQRALAAGEGDDATQARLALAELEPVMPGISRLWNGRVSRTVWDPSSGPRGSYAYYPPGYVTSLHGVEAESEGPFHFAGEHTSRAWQGFLNGAVESGQRAAREVLKASGRG